MKRNCDFQKASIAAFLVFINVANVNICELKYGSGFRQAFIFHSLFPEKLLQGK